MMEVEVLEESFILSHPNTNSSNPGSVIFHPRLLTPFTPLAAVIACLPPRRAASGEYCSGKHQSTNSVSTRRGYRVWVPFVCTQVTGPAHVDDRAGRFDGQRRLN